jgi:hypothetical protein
MFAFSAGSPVFFHLDDLPDQVAMIASTCCSALAAISVSIKGGIPFRRYSMITQAPFMPFLHRDVHPGSCIHIYGFASSPVNISFPLFIQKQDRTPGMPRNISEGYDPSPRSNDCCLSACKQDQYAEKKQVDGL